MLPRYFCCRHSTVSERPNVVKSKINFLESAEKMQGAFLTQQSGSHIVATTTADIVTCIQTNATHQARRDEL